MGHFSLIPFIVLMVWLLRRDSRHRSGISPAIWIPTIWIGVLMSRPLSMWLGFGGGTDTLEGSPLDRLFHLFVIGYSAMVLYRRRLNWGAVLSGNWAIVVFYGFFLISVLWADPPFVSLKRWIKDFGMVLVALVILTEQKPMEAIRAVFVRCAYVLLPLSIVFVRWIPELGRFYNRGGFVQITGVTTQKNSLGITAMICGLMFLWDWLEYRRVRGKAVPDSRREGLILVVAMGISVYLLHLSQSKTSLLCFILGAVLMAVAYVDAWTSLMRRAGLWVFFSVGGYYALDTLFGLSESILGLLGRDATFTGRTDVWREILALNTDPIIGTGFCNFWSNEFYQSQLPSWIAFSCHNGYLEVFVDGGWLGILALVVMLAGVWGNINSHLRTGDRYAMLRLTVLVCLALGSFSESHFGRLGPLWFLFILTSFDPRRVALALPVRSALPFVPRSGVRHPYPLYTHRCR